jgi:hypothetical protein
MGPRPDCPRTVRPARSEEDKQTRRCSSDPIGCSCWPRSGTPDATKTRRRSDRRWGGRGAERRSSGSRGDCQRPAARRPRRVRVRPRGPVVDAGRAVLPAAARHRDSEREESVGRGARGGRAGRRSGERRGARRFACPTTGRVRAPACRAARRIGSAPEAAVSQERRTRRGSPCHGGSRSGARDDLIECGRRRPPMTSRSHVLTKTIRATGSQCCEARPPFANRR